MHKLKEFVVRINDIIPGIIFRLDSIKQQIDHPYESFRKHLQLWTLKYSFNSIALLSRIRGAGTSIKTRIRRAREFLLKKDSSLAADEIESMIADLVGVNIHVLKVDHDLALFVQSLVHDLVELSEDSNKTKSQVRNAKASLENRTKRINEGTTQETHLESDPIITMCVSKLESLEAAYLELSFSVAFLQSSASAFGNLIREFGEMIIAESDSLASIPISGRSVDETRTLWHLDRASIRWGDITTVVDLEMEAYYKHIAASWHRHNTRSL